MPGIPCPRCGREQPESSAGGTCQFCGADLPATGPMPPPPPAPEPTPPPPPVPETGGAVELEAGKRQCPGCGEVLYDTEARCWRCGYDFPQAQPADAEAAAPEAVAPPPEAPPALPLPPPPVPMPPPVAPPSYPTPAVAAADKQAQALGVWGLVIGIVGLLFCGGIISPAAIILGVKANRTAPNGLGTVSILLGVIGTLMLVIILACFIIGLVTEGGKSHPSASPDVLLPQWHLFAAFWRGVRAA